jgi:nucleoside phosphorylase
MIYFVFALHQEAKPFIEHYKLKAVAKKSPFKQFSSSCVVAIISGMGQDKAMIATTYLCATYLPTKSDLLINIGLAGSNQPIGSLWLINDLYHHEEQRHFYPDILLQHTMNEASLCSVRDPQKDPLNGCVLVDMEAVAIYKSAIYFFSTNKMAFLKIVSDHFNPIIPDKMTVATWMDTHKETIVTFIDQLHDYHQGKSNAVDHDLQPLQQMLRLTKAQTDILNDALSFRVLSGKTIDLSSFIVENIKTKEERNRHFDTIITTLRS